MLRKERELYDEIIVRFNHIKDMNKAWLQTIWWNKKSSQFLKLKESWLYRKEYDLLDYIDWRKNLIHIPNYCEFSWQKISKKRIKNALTSYKETLIK